MAKKDIPEAAQPETSAPQAPEEQPDTQVGAAASEAPVDENTPSDTAATPEVEPETQTTAPDLEKLQAELTQSEEARQTAEEKVLRAHAEVQNIRRRAQQDVEKAHKFALEKFANELLPVVDNLERGLESAEEGDAAVEAIREGVAMTLELFHKTLEKFNITPLNPEGAPFNPEHHQAMSMVESAEQAPNTVLHVMQKGYLLNGRLLRPAMVVVTKAPAGQSASIDEKA